MCFCFQVEPDFCLNFEDCEYRGMPLSACLRNNLRQPGKENADAWMRKLYLSKIAKQYLRFEKERLRRAGPVDLEGQRSPAFRGDTWSAGEELGFHLWGRREETDFPADL